ncbi:DUF411 domain-containing protein [Noviherbaspirillum saxi]|uniref:DUF411 domain-containing protein n=1 Tax=Noviherbaspirillum saxi TaxID=2320863 RepID=A0A3A3FQ83_9BURK|nr:DUF411 domain-containing protein [Noviherbaspirillum saxi]RJF97620.1 DUF411 domain-containing protein [Noviherbaspirillum saxi]
MQRRTLLQGALAALLMPAAAHAAPTVIKVYKTPSCGCCHEWVAHLEQNGFTVKATDVPDTSPYRAKYGVPKELASCHTGVVAGYALEGHVPAEQVKRLLAERPKAKGLAVPGMPVGSPGMEVEGNRKDAFDVVLIKANGKHQVYRHYDAS